MEDYLEATRDLEIEKSVFVECDVVEPSIPDETNHVLRIADQPDNPVEGVVASARPEKKGFKAYLETIVGHPKLKGIRRILHTQPDELGQGKLFIENVQSLAGYGLSFDICVLARQLPIAINLISKCPDVNFILDHCGVPEVKGQNSGSLARAHPRDFQNAECHLQDIRPGRLCRPRHLDR
jgi:predicted TIM-barrel fold metal-dependent hydrolase